MTLDMAGARVLLNGCESVLARATKTGLGVARPTTESNWLQQSCLQIDPVIAFRDEPAPITQFGVLFRDPMRDFLSVANQYSMKSDRTRMTHSREELFFVPILFLVHHSRWKKGQTLRDRSVPD